MFAMVRLYEVINESKTKQKNSCDFCKEIRYKIARLLVFEDIKTLVLAKLKTVFDYL